MANENFYTYVSAGTRTVQNVGDISDTIQLFGVAEWPLYDALRKRKVKDNYPRVIVDTLAAVSTTNYHAEGATAPAAVDQARTLQQNWAQLKMITAEVSDTQNEIDQYGMGNELAYEEPLKIKELMRSLEADIVSNQALQAPTHANGNIGKMAGMGALITTTTSSTWSLAVVETTMNTLVNTYGSNPTRLYMMGTNKIAVSGWTTAPTRFTTDIKSLEKEVNILHTCFGPSLQVYNHHLMPKDIAGAGAPHALLLDMGLWEIATLIPLRRTELPKDGSSTGVFFEIQCCVLCRGQQGNAYWDAS